MSAAAKAHKAESVAIALPTAGELATAGAVRALALAACPV